MNTLQPEPAHGDLGHLDPKIFRRGKYFNVRIREGCLARQRIGKAKNSTPRHFRSPKKTKLQFGGAQIIGRSMNLRTANGGSDRSCILALLILLINVPILTAATLPNDIRWHLHSWHANAFKFRGTLRRSDRTAVNRQFGRHSLALAGKDANSCSFLQDRLAKAYRRGGRATGALRGRHPMNEHNHLF